MPRLVSRMRTLRTTLIGITDVPSDPFTLTTPHRIG
jgi:hypothetical protein